MKKMFENVNWVKVGEKLAYGAAIVTAIVGAVSDQKKEAELKQLKDDVAQLKNGKS